MTLFASFSGNPVLGLLLLPFFFGGPFVLLRLEVRAFLRSEAQSLTLLALLVILGILAGLYCFATGLVEFNQTQAS
jgi:hypothetical protein